VPKGSPDARVIPALEPQGDEMVFPKTSSSVFLSTNIAYVLRNLKVEFLIICGCLTDQCIASAVRDACDLGFLVTVVTDACIGSSQEAHTSSLRNMSGYGRQRTTKELLKELDLF
jgi:ureidoacrylate peracid hydrolase